MSILLKLLMTGGVVAGALRAKLLAVRRSAGVVAILTAAALIASSIGAAGLAAAAFFALRPSMADYQAALLVAGIFIILAAIAVLVVVSKVKRVIGTRGPERSTVAAPSPALQAQARTEPPSDDPLVRLISASVQNPVVLSALALGIFAGRATKRSRRD